MRSFLNIYAVRVYFFKRGVPSKSSRDVEAVPPPNIFFNKKTFYIMKLALNIILVRAYRYKLLGLNVRGFNVYKDKLVELKLKLLRIDCERK